MLLDGYIFVASDSVFQYAHRGGEVRILNLLCLNNCQRSLTEKEWSWYLTSVLSYPQGTSFVLMLLGLYLYSCQDSHAFTFPYDFGFWDHWLLLLDISPRCFPHTLLSFHIILRNACSTNGRDILVFSLLILIALILLTPCLLNGGKCRNNCQIHRKKQIERSTWVLRDAFPFHWRYLDFSMQLLCAFHYF